MRGVSEVFSLNFHNGLVNVGKEFRHPGLFFVLPTKQTQKFLPLYIQIPALLAYNGIQISAAAEVQSCQIFGHTCFFAKN